MEYLLGQQGMFERIREKRKQRESQQVQIIDYDGSELHQQKFKELNAEWIEKYFRLEEKDLQSLNDPEKYILDKGGHILLACYNNEITGACALLKMDEQTYELAKMAVSPAAQVKNIGYILGRAVIEKARILGATTVYLESNTKLEPAINLYHKLGFKKVTGKPTPYERCNIQMELALD
ncbi:MAG: GNAT family N-acetyltransferase [Hymenobacteraceae bacterium]|nr:GNAT family N-acetyltransferase [Hymenobacteraceae bacterium]MDX5394818.1 GNAT family N-acetyltransferase [Hymenobacteraceae bacterium]MDX5510852.1 GNAT family N-acetyltransferase [Hymenobacteraceae bacterium]